MTTLFALTERGGNDLETTSAAAAEESNATTALSAGRTSLLRNPTLGLPTETGDPLVEEDLYSYQLLSVTAVCVFLIAIVGTLGNLLAAVSLLLSRKLRQSPSTAFMVNLLTCLLPVCAVGLPMFGAGYISFRDSGRIPYSEEVAIACFTLGLILSQVHIHTICALAFNRLLAVMWPVLYKKVMQPRRVRLYILILWLYSAILWLPLLFGMTGKLEIDYKELMVSVRDDSRYKIGKAVHLFFTYLLPVTFSSVCYVAMYIKVRRSRRQKAARKRCKSVFESSTTSEETVLRQWDDHVTRTILVIFLVLLTCSVPHVVIHALHLHKVLPAAWLLLHVVFWLQFCVDPVVYVSMSQQYRRACAECLSRFLPGPRDGGQYEPRNEIKADSNIVLQSTWRKNMNTRQKFDFVTELGS